MLNISLVIADDHAMFRQGIRLLLNSVADMQLLAEADEGEAFIEAVLAQRPRVAILDLSMPGPGARAIVQRLEAQAPEVQLMALTMHLEPQYAQDLMQLGLAGYVVKDAAFDELLDAIRCVAEGDQFVSAQLLDQTQTPALTQREQQCLSGVAAGQTSKMIARRLGITERTVRYHLGNCCQKLGVQRRSQAVAEAVRRHLITHSV